MSNGSSIDYKTGSKNHWRRWLWNRIDERVLNKQDSVVLYLCGPQDLDRQEAIRRGFDNRNLIGIDLDKDNVAACRAGGNIAIRANLIDVAMAWPLHTKICVIIGDFCGDLCGRMWTFVEALANDPRYAGTTYALNFQRGRGLNSSSQKWTDLITSTLGFATKLRNEIVLAAMFEFFFDTARMMASRGCAEKDITNFFFSTLFKDQAELDRHCDLIGKKIRGGVEMEMWNAMAWQYAKASRAALMSYRSSRHRALYFDSVVGRVPEIKGKFRVEIDKKAFGTALASTKTLAQTKRKITAALAVRTQRLAA